jgi:hypothetical protein
MTASRWGCRSVASPPEPAGTLRREHAGGSRGVVEGGIAPRARGARRPERPRRRLLAPGRRTELIATRRRGESPSAAPLDGRHATLDHCSHLWDVDRALAPGWQRASRSPRPRRSLRTSAEPLGGEAHAYEPAPEGNETAGRLLDRESAGRMLVAAHAWDRRGRSRVPGCLRRSSTARWSTDRAPPPARTPPPTSRSPTYRSSVELLEARRHASPRGRAGPDQRARAGWFSAVS